MPARLPERIVCLTEETTETLYLLGEERRIVGISGYTVRPPRARREKPRVAMACGVDVFSDLSHSHAATGRIVKPDAVVERKPDVMIASWCGKKFRPERVTSRPGWSAVPAVRDGELHEIKSAEILQPGPAALTDGVRRLHQIIARWAEKQGVEKQGVRS